MKKFIIGLAIVLGAFVVAVLFFTWYRSYVHVPMGIVISDAVYKTKDMPFGDTTIHTLVADTPELRSLGLGGREVLKSGQGMLFIFDTDAPYGFWMKDMKISIDIIWLDSNKKVVYMAQSISPSTYPSSFAPSVPARYVLEVPAGYTVAHNVKIGDHVSF